MCTLALVRHRFERFPLLVAANRDERLDRASSPPRLWDDAMPFVGGRDEVAGGTWLGVNRAGLVIGLTNHWTGAPPDPARASRGAVVRHALACADLDALRRHLATLDPDATNPFLLLAADRRGEALWTDSADGLRVHHVETEIFALGNRRPAEDPAARARRLGDDLGAALAGHGDDPDGLLATLSSRLALHRGDRGPLESVCVHTDRGYGTVSSTVVLLGATPTDDRLWHAPGPPCTTAFADASEFLRSLHRA